MNRLSLGKSLITAGAVLGLMLGAAGAANADKGGNNKNRISDRCKARAASVGKMDASWEVKKPATTQERKRFGVKFEAAVASGLPSGATLTVAVSTVDPATQVVSFVEVGQMILKDGHDEDTQVEGSLRFDSKNHSKSSDAWQPFPAVWPTDVGNGTEVVLRNGATDLISCDMH
jgi:hypothetical protein